MRLPGIIFSIAIVLVVSNGTVASAAPVGRVNVIARAAGNCGDPCTIRASNGGSVVDFYDAGIAIRSGARKKLVIDGYCGSSCMTMADLARPRACITSKAVFAYHKTNFNRPIPLRADLTAWIMQNGGFPSFRGRPGIMSNSVARKFWPMCDSPSKMVGVGNGDEGVF